MSSASVVRCVSGDIAPDALGRTNYHEHLFQVSPLLVGDELDDEERSGAEAADCAASGFEALVDATPIGLGRRPAALARIAAATGLHIVATTGAHRDAHYRPGDPLTELSVAGLAALMRRDLLEAMPEHDEAGGAAPAVVGGRPVRAGMLKAAADYWAITPFECRVLDAVAGVQLETGAPVTVHLEHGSASVEVLDRLESAGVAADRVVLAHMDRNPDPGLHAELAARGAYVGYDSVARSRDRPDVQVLECLVAAAERGARERLLLGADVARRTRFRAYGGMPGLAYLGERFVPRLRAAGGEALVRAVLVENPARLLAWRTPRAS